MTPTHLVSETTFKILSPSVMGLKWATENSVGYDHNLRLPSMYSKFVVSAPERNL